MKRLRDWYDGLAERERRLLLVLVGMFTVGLVLLVPYGSSALLSDGRDQNAALRNAISLVQNSRTRMEEIAERKKSIEHRYDNPAPALAGFIEDAARKSGLEIPESQDRADVPHGKKFMERATVVRLRKVGMLPLVQMLERLENAGHPIIISRLNIRKRGREPDSYDVEIGVSAFDRVKPKKDTSSPKTAASEEAP